MTDLEAFRQAGRALFSLGLVREAEGNLSTFDGRTLRITRTGCSLAALGRTDLVAGSLVGELPGASSDLEFHRELYRGGGPGAVAHAHPAGSMPEGGKGPGEHGVYEFAPTLREATEAVVAWVRERASAPGERAGP